jgi:hypothetical protein
MSLKSNADTVELLNAAGGTIQTVTYGPIEEDAVVTPQRSSSLRRIGAAPFERVWWCNRKRRCGILRVGGANVCNTLIAIRQALRLLCAPALDTLARGCSLGRVAERLPTCGGQAAVYRAFTLNLTFNGFFESKAHNLRGSAWRLGP